MPANETVLGKPSLARSASGTREGLSSGLRVAPKSYVHLEPVSVALLGKGSLQMELSQGSQNEVVLDQGGPKSNDECP